MVGLLNPMKYGDHFYELYTSNTRRKLQNERKALTKRKSRKEKSAAAMAAAAAAAVLEGNAGAIVNPLDPPLVKDQMLFFPAFPVAHIELDPNASKFAVFSAIRSTVLEAETRYALFHEGSGSALTSAAVKKWGVGYMDSSCCLVCAGSCMVSNLVDCSCHAAMGAGGAGIAGGGGGPGGGAGGAAAAAAQSEKRVRRDSANSDADSDTEEPTEREPVYATVPLIVGAGLRSLFELIADARHIQPLLCTKALKALLDVIQGQQPESFKLEPEELINPLYDLLLDLATMPAALSSSTGAEANWSAMACSALLGLCIARGDTGKMLKAIAAMLMSPKQLSAQIIQLPAVLAALQNTVVSAALNKPTRPDFHSHGVPQNSLIDEFPLQLGTVAPLMQPAMACDGVFVYLLHGGALLKIGTGFGGSYKGHIYAQNDDFTKERSAWLGYSGGQLYFRRNSKRNADHLHLVGMDTLAVKAINPVNMLPIREGFNYVLFTDDDSLHAICTNRDDTLVVKKLNLYHNSYTSEPPPFELPLQLARKKFRTLGYAAFEDEVLNQNQIQRIQSSHNNFEPKLPCRDVDVLGMACGKEFGLVRAGNGKVYFYGKSASLGLKSVGRTPTLKLTELIISKAAHIVHVAVGHDGIHALLVNDDGTVYFAGTARRGEDGDSSKNRRQPKAVKPKKMTKIDGHVVVHAACNNGTSAFVTKTGKLIMFGKDTAHCDAMGFVSDLIDQHVTKVALGKAHCVTLNAKGQLYTFGLNNKGQCGRVFNKVLMPTTTTTAATTIAKDMAASSSAYATLLPLAPAVGSTSGVDKRPKVDFSTLCDYDDHNLVQGQCRVCVMCRECTGYNVSCVSALNVPLEERLAGSICPCGHGDAGCAKCGLCAACIALQESENTKLELKPLPSDLHRQQRSKTLIMRRKEKKQGCCPDLDASSTPTDYDKDPPRVAPLAPQLLTLPSSSPVVQVACGLHHTVVLTLAGEVFTFGSNQYGQLGTGDLQPVNGPVKVHVQGAISQVAAGSNHTVLMTHKGMVYTFGNYQKGQLGRLPSDYGQKERSVGQEEEVSHRAMPSPILPKTTAATQETGVLPGGSREAHPPAQLSASATAAAILAQRQKFLWNCAPGPVFGLGPNYGKKVTWIGANGDQTFIKIDESLITAQMLPKMHVVANKKTILLIPTIPLSFHTLSINRRDGSCTAHYRNQVNFVQTQPEINQNVDVAASPPISELVASASTSAGGGAGMPINEQMSRSMHEARNQVFDQEQFEASPMATSQQRQRRARQRPEPCAGSSAGPASPEKPQPQIAFAMDPNYNVLWVFDGIARKLRCHNVVASEIVEGDMNARNYRALLSPELSLPIQSEARVSRSQASLNLLACLDILTSAQENIPGCFDEVLPKQPHQTFEAQSSEYQVVNRFDNFGGGWGYSGHSVEAIRFAADTDIMICGFGMFGGRGEYTCKLKLYDLGTDGGGYEKEGVLLSETKEVPFECAARSRHHILLPKPINAAAGRWYLVWARIAGPSSDCGSCGQASVTTEDQVVFSFKSSKKANNGTDVNSGQIPAILYRLVTQESKQPPAPLDVDPVQRISKAFANSVSRECFESLVVLLSWSWETFKANLREQRDKSRPLQVQQSLEYLGYVNKSCLRLLRKYTNEIYPQRAATGAATGQPGMSAAASAAAASSMVAAAISKLPPKLSANKQQHDPAAKDKNAARVLSSAASSLLANNVAKYFGDAATAAATAATSNSCSTGTSITRKPNMENIQLAECIGNVRALLIGIFCDDIFKDIATDEGFALVLEILEECHLSFVACFDAFYPTSSLKWNCLCDLLAQMDRGALHSRLLSAILAGLCSPTVKLRATFSLLSAGNERQSIISPSDNSGLPMLSSTEAHQYPILVEQMIYRTQQEKSDFLSNSWTFKDVLVRLLEIIASPIRARIETIYNRSVSGSYAAASVAGIGKDTINQGLIDNCCHLLARVLAEIVYQTALGEYDKMFLPPRTLHSTGSRFARCDLSRTWNTGNFGPDAIAFSVDRPGIAIAGAMVYSGSGSYDYQLELLYDNTADLQPQHKWETLESVSGSYDQDVVHNDLTELKFEHPVHIKENARYALRLCSQGARTCSGDAGLPSVRGPCGATFHFYACDLSFNGTTPARGQLPCILYYSTPIRQEANGSNGGGGAIPGDMSSGLGTQAASEVSTRDTALQIAADITKKCTELLILARNAMAASFSPSDNSSNHTQTIDSEHNITPIEEHMDINWANNSRTAALPVDPNLSTARDLSKRIESFSKGIIETLKFDKRSTNPFEMEIEIGATEIGVEETADLNFRNGQMAKLNGNERAEDEVVEEFVHAHPAHQQALLVQSDSEEAPASAHVAAVQLLEVFNLAASNMFHTLLPLVYAHIANLACSDPKSSVQILGLIKDILPHIAALNQMCVSKEQRPVLSAAPLQAPSLSLRPDASGSPSQSTTTSNHYCVVESEHPYRSASISCYRVEFPPCVQWLTIEFDAQCGTAQLEDYLLLSIPLRPTAPEPCQSSDDYYDMLDNNLGPTRRTAGSNCRNAQVLMSSCYKTSDNTTATTSSLPAQDALDRDWIVVKKFNTASNWLQNVLILPGNCVEFSLETASLYAQDPHNNRYGFKCLVVGYDNPTTVNASNSCLIRLEQELAYLGGMCSANLMKKDLNLPDDKDIDDLSGIEETISAHHVLLSKGFALSEPTLTVHQALESYLPIGSQSNERQFLKDFVSGAPGSSGARLAAWLQPESRLDPNKCELNTITEPLRYGWPTQVTVTIRDQYGDAVLVPELKVEIKAIPTGPSGNGNMKMRRVSCADGVSAGGHLGGGVVPPPRLNYEPTTKEKMCFKAITFMKPYTNYSFEELRYSSPVQTRTTEALYAQDMEDGTFSVHWTPNSVGGYCLAVTIDGIPLEEVYRVEVKEGVLPPPAHRCSAAKRPQPPNKLRKFQARHSAGLRIRSHPTLQSEQVGVVRLSGVISFIDEIENDDGIWLRLSTESIRQHCTMGWYPTEAWCLQFNQHLAKTLLHPVTDASAPTIPSALAPGTKVRHKALPDSGGVETPPAIGSTSSSPNGSESPSKPKSASPSKKIFDFTHGSGTPGSGATARHTAVKSSDSTSTNPFLLPSKSTELLSDESPATIAVAAPPVPVAATAPPTPPLHGELLHTLQHTSPANLGSAIAGVVGGGAIKLQALQKWFKGDAIEGGHPASITAATMALGSPQHHQHQRKRSDVGELASVSVRELVRAMGGQEQVQAPPPLQPRGNGNNRCSPLPAADITDVTPAEPEFDISSIRKTNYSASQTAALLSTPKHSPRRAPLRLGNSPPPPPLEVDMPQLEDELGLLQITTTTTAASEQSELYLSEVPKTAATTSGGSTTTNTTGSASADTVGPPVWPVPNKRTGGTMGPIKRAMPPSFAESIRAVFAAFLWHEGVVHDAMACASFLKFHPSLPKEGATVVTRRDAGDARLQLSREQKAQQRHSVEVANAGHYLNIRPSTLETLTKSGNSSLHNRSKHRKNLQSEDADKQKLHALPEVVTVLPPALRCLVYLWEQICANCVQIVQSNTLERERLLSPTARDSCADAKESKETVGLGADKELGKKSKRKKKDDGSWCEICEVFLPIPVTYHMRIAHPGCGKSAKGKGYNSVGIFCEGWAGNCGEGGKGASSWFLMCDACREKYLATNKNTNNVNSAPHVTNSVGNELNLFGVKTTTLIANSEVYTTMRENATFLLELCSSVSSLPSAPPAADSKRSPKQPMPMPVVIEHQHFTVADLNKPSTSRADSTRNSRIGNALRMSGKFGGGVSGTPFRKSFTGTSATVMGSPDNMWLAPDSFACLECLGTTAHEDLPYEMFGLSANEQGYDRPLSEISYESCDPNNYELMSGSMANAQAASSATSGTLSKFHRSYSMGQGWSMTQQQQPAIMGYKGGSGGGCVGASGVAVGTCVGTEDPTQPKVIFRRRNNSTSEGDGSLLICYPSEHLRRLVPEKILASAVVQSATQRIAAESCSLEVQRRGNANDKQQQQQQHHHQKNVTMSGFEQPGGTKEQKVPPLPPPLSPGVTAATSELNQAQLNALLSRPAMAFITQKHDLDKLRYAMKRSLRIAACRIFSLQALNWLLRSVTQCVCLHDLMWWFVSSLSLTSVELIDGKYEEVEPALEHPVSYTQISGRFAHLITQSLHVLLQSVADLTLHLPLGSPLQRVAIQCFGIRFRQADHQFLHSSHVFGNISKILSKSDEQNDAMAVSTLIGGSGGVALNVGEAHCDAEQNFATNVVPTSGSIGAGGAGAKVLSYTDLSGMFEVTVSSRPAMAESLTDNSTETFWESDEEDRNKCKIIEISMSKLNYACKFVLVHIDNSRDIQNKVLNVVFYAGQSLGDTNLIKSVDVDQKACSWISAKINDESCTHFRLEFHGPENTLRVRQIKLLGFPSSLSAAGYSCDDQAGEHPGMPTHKHNLKLAHATRIQQQICESETLRVFRLITGQVFGKLISNVSNDTSHRLSASGTSLLADSLDLREHMVGILFSRSKLSHLQKQVIVHIVHAIKKEALRAKEDWDLVNLAHLTHAFKEPPESQAGVASQTGNGEGKSESSSSERYRAPDTYCFEMLSMVLALSGSVVGRSYLSHQHGLLKDLLSLLHTGSDRVQRQVTALLRRILPEISPESFAELLGVQRLPPADYNIAHQNASDFDMNRLGLLDIFLSVIAKSLQLQVKVKTSAKPNLEKSPAFVRLCSSLDLSVHLLRPRPPTAPLEHLPCESRDPFRFDAPQGSNAPLNYNNTLKAAPKKESKKNLNQRWFLNGIISTKQAESIIALIRDLASGKLSEKWSQITKAAIAESVLNLTRLDEVFRTPEHCTKTATLWLALASLCVLERDHVEKLSSGQWSKVSDTRPMCSNHDDGETAAIIQCETCGSLCGDCDRFLHLNRKTRTHKRTVCKEEEEAIRVELHESCGRTKLFWLLALADSKTLKAMVEFRDGSHTIISGPQEAVGRCRFCGITGNSGLLEIGNVCADAQCQDYAASSCLKTKPCGHACGGVVGEKKCLPCLQHVCHARENELAEELRDPKLTQDADDMCMICFVEALSCAPSIHLECGHVFHFHCSKAVLEKRWSGPRITFGFSLCPICKADIQHPLLGDILEPINGLKQDVKRKALMRIKYEGVVKDTDSKDVTQLAMDRYAYYVCFKCQKAYYGGEARCDAEIGEKFDPEELVCGGCSDVARAQMCPKHGTDFLEYKCRYCCSVAVFFCFGTTHFCDTCHDDFQRLTNIPKNKLPQCPAGPKAKQLLGDECPLHVMHPPTGEEFALGCGVCRNAQTF
ncbi:E3 ubiquitin-protein ligase highwire [Scaptodrosophila lebanonensis]|uniref:RCR-type E3 ubiquitin transferase n=1 Tax=Drosophila lebanonensis TaxID=7225 RepID=A0A6J2TP19_DROLE|nr:E3 ubiquitin-protein ligase highwire [Scaptodrosophila lebanonensis]